MSIDLPTNEGTDIGVHAGQIRAKQRLHWGRHLTALAVIITIIELLLSMISNPRYEWRVVGSYFASPIILAGLQRTLELTLIAMIIGVSLGSVIAILRTSNNYVLSGIAGWYVWFFRGVPLLVQLIFWYNLAALYPNLSLGIPFGGPTLLHGGTNSIISIWVAACLGLGLCEAAYESEIIRAGIASVPRGQVHAAQALGMRRGRILRRIVLPQAMTVIIPPIGNQVIGMLKTTSLVSVIALADLLYSAELVYSRTFQTIPLLLVATAWYLILMSVFSTGQFFLERHFGRGSLGSESRRFMFADAVVRRRDLRWKEGQASNASDESR